MRHSSWEITEFAIPSGYNASRITKGPDGNLWFTENFGNKIGRITPSGTITEFPIPTPGSYPFGITTGADGNIWFAEELGNKIGRITPSGAISEFPIVGPGTGPVDITSGPDGNLWFTEQGQYFGRITTSGVITSFPIAAIGSGLLTTGPDGNLWITDYYGNKVFKAVICSAPTVTANASPSILWPPNHKMVSVSINAATSGGCDSSLCKIVSVSSNEPIDADGDWVITGDLSLQLRAERLGQGTGRIYTITIRCTDGSGNQTTKGVTVTAPHDQGK